jgi:hypothetical protein
LAALVMTAASNTQSASKSAAARKQHSIQSAASPNEGGHHAAEADAETFTGANVIDEHSEAVLKKHVRARRQQANNAAAQNPINAIGKILKKAGNRAENAISNTLKGGAKKQPAKKNKGKGKGTQVQGNAGAPQPRVIRKTTAVPNPDYSDIEVDENGNPVVLNEADIPDEIDADPKSANQTGTVDQGEDFPPYGGDYAGAMDEGPVSYPDENPPTSPKKNKKKGGKKKNNGKKGGKKAITKRNKKKTNKKQGVLDGT